MEHYCKSLEPEILYGHRLAEQTLMALLVSRSGKRWERLPDSYGISHGPINRQTISHHFVSDGSRPGFYTDGLRRLRKSGFLAKYSRRSGLLNA